MTSVAKPPHVRATSRIVAGLLALFVVFLGGGAHAQSTIRVLVNEEPITSFDIKQRTRMLAVFTQGRLRAVRRLHALGFIEGGLEMPPRLGQMLGCFVLAQDEALPRRVAQLALHLM